MSALTKKFYALNAILALLFSSCSNDNIQTLTNQPVPDSLISKQVKSIYKYYLNDSAIYPSSQGSGHIGSVRVGFNQIAWQELGEDGKLAIGSQFQNNSMITKELYSNNELTGYAFMYKRPSDPSSGAGWVWGYLNLDGQVLRASNGRGCIGCHSVEGNRDLVRTFELR